MCLFILFIVDVSPLNAVNACCLANNNLLVQGLVKTFCVSSKSLYQRTLVIRWHV